MASAHEAPSQQSTDPRIRRSRSMLHQALSSLLAQKAFEKISIQEIAEAATLNRATFYDHYPDKFALLRCMVGSRFSELLERRGLRITSCDGALRALILAACDFLLDLPLAPGETDRRPPASMQNAIIEILGESIGQGLAAHPPAGAASPPVVAAAVAWAIYGAANQWIQAPDRLPAEQIAGIIERLVSPLMSGSVT